MDPTFWNSISPNLSYAYRFTLDALGYPVARDANGDISGMAGHPTGPDIESAERFAVDYNEVVTKNPQLNLQPLASTFGLDLSDERYDALQTALELAKEEGAEWSQIVEASRQKLIGNFVQAVQAVTPGSRLIKTNLKSTQSTPSSSSGGYTPLILVGVAAVAVLALSRSR